MQSLKSQNLEFLSQLLKLCFPEETKNTLVFAPDCPFLINQAPEDCHCRLYITPKHFSAVDREIISESPFGFFKEHQICSPEDNPYSSKFWDQILYLPGVSLHCLKEEYLNL